MGQVTALLTSIGWTLPVLPELDDLTVGEDYRVRAEAPCWFRGRHSSIHDRSHHLCPPSAKGRAFSAYLSISEQLRLLGSTFSSLVQICVPVTHVCYSSSAL